MLPRHYKYKNVTTGKNFIQGRLATTKINLPLFLKRQVIRELKLPKSTLIWSSNYWWDKSTKNIKLLRRSNNQSTKLP